MYMYTGMVFHAQHALEDMMKNPFVYTIMYTYLYVIIDMNTHLCI
jgi:hypothetical protein